MLSCNSPLTQLKQALQGTTKSKPLKSSVAILTGKNSEVGGTL